MAKTTADIPADVIETNQEILPAVKMVKLKTVDDTEFEVEEAIAKEFLTLKPFIEEESYSDSPIPLPNVPSAVFVKIIEYCRKKFELDAKAKALDCDDAGGKRTGDFRAFEEAFVKDMTNEDIKNLILVANYLNITDLLNFLCGCVANRIKNKSVAYVRNFFGIEGDYTEEEENALRELHPWAYEGVDED
ncbi:hypothetical protein L6164_018116 [Bauhinia variegata]|uniref:Uncharacterized protein n=1 Tax=Bauhinia variegata TaxID=167791 RepID=A0ACB9NAS4_BAUVA|nr:hypothetical protein L6164_018116 [Bauhinia variegata]